jgi:hypothetical protein
VFTESSKEQIVAIGETFIQVMSHVLIFHLTFSRVSPAATQLGKSGGYAE